MSSPNSKIFILAAIAMSTAVWEITFNLGVFNTIFFNHGFTVWVASTAAFLASLFVRRPTGAPLLQWRGRFVMLLPTAWLLLILFSGPEAQDQGATGLVFWATVGVVLVALPYVLYVVVLLITPDLMALKDRRLSWALAGIVVLIGLIGYGVGVRNELFVTCYEFKVSGNDLPPRCTEQLTTARSES